MTKLVNVLESDEEELSPGNSKGEPNIVCQCAMATVLYQLPAPRLHQWGHFFFIIFWKKKEVGYSGVKK